MHIGDITIENMSKVYGHAGLDVKIRGSRIKEVKLNISESSRLFESLVTGKKFDQVTSIASRICGICSPSHNITSVMAIENALGISPSEQTRRLRELFICGGWIQSHSLHSYFMALPDYLGIDSMLDVAGSHKNYLEKALRLKKLGNELALCIGGRDVHASTTTAGGFTHIPERKQLNGLSKMLKKGRTDAMKTAGLFASFKKPVFERKKAFISLKEKGGYAIISGKVCKGDEQMNAGDYRKKLSPEIRPYSTSKFVKFNKSEFMVGPLARINANNRNLSKNASKAMRKLGLELPEYSPFNANLARVVELVHCIDRSIEIVKNLKPVEEDIKSVRLTKNFYEGCAVTEAPRGILYHSYRINRKGIITGAEIITPTAGNLLCIENDIRNFLPGIIKRPKNKIITSLEELVRSYDPCLSCATHFLEVNFL